MQQMQKPTGHAGKARGFVPDWKAIGATAAALAVIAGATVVFHRDQVRFDEFRHRHPLVAPIMTNSPSRRVVEIRLKNGEWFNTGLTDTTQAALQRLQKAAAEEGAGVNENPYRGGSGIH